MIYIVNINNKVYEVEVEKGKANLIKTTTVAEPIQREVAVQVDNTPKPALIPAQALLAAAGSVSGEAVKAPMPGTILDVKVSQGTSVKKGQLLFILEAMKMENEIFSPFDGVISQIVVSKGSSVSTNDVLLVLQ